MCARAPRERVCHHHWLRKDMTGNPQPRRHSSQGGRQLRNTGLPLERAKGIPKVELHDDVSGVGPEMCLDVMQHHEATLWGAHSKLSVLQVRLQGGPRLAQEQLTEHLGPDGSYQNGPGASAWLL